MNRLVRTVFIVAVAAELLWVILDGFINYAHWIDDSSVRKIFNVAREESLPTWFAVVQTLAVGIVAFLLARRAKHDGAKPSVRPMLKRNTRRTPKPNARPIPKLKPNARQIPKPKAQSTRSCSSMKASRSPHAEIMWLPLKITMKPSD